jgi:hypothetical protein
MRSGNLNFTVPLIKAMSRTGGGATFNLSYNSQNWRQDPGGEWQSGRDLGYGYGWKLQAGSLTPVYDGIYQLDHYEFVDSTGAEYRLDQNVQGSPVWSSAQSIYVYYDSNAGRLYFQDGSFWSFGCTSAGTEQDAGTMYPTFMYDTNGNWIALSYDNGAGVTYAYSSSRIYYIEDVRGNGTHDYSFTYHIPQRYRSVPTPDRHQQHNRDRGELHVHLCPEPAVDRAVYAGHRIWNLGVPLEASRTRFLSLPRSLMIPRAPANWIRSRSRMARTTSAGPTEPFTTTRAPGRSAR